MAARAVGGEHVVAARDRAVAEAPFEVGNQVAVVVARVGLHGLAFVLARFAQVGGVGPARQQERADVAEPVLDGAEGGAVAAALGDVERGLAEVAALRIELAQVGEVVDPALFGTRADVEVDALDRLVEAVRILAALEDVVHGFLRDALAPALAVARSEEHTSELQSLMRSSYAVFCLTKKNKTIRNTL